jgi:hypothetical protein
MSIFARLAPRLAIIGIIIVAAYILYLGFTDINKLIKIYEDIFKGEFKGYKHYTEGGWGVYGIMFYIAVVPIAIAIALRREIVGIVKIFAIIIIILNILAALGLIKLH